MAKTITGTSAADTIKVTESDVTVKAGAGNDTITISGGTGNLIYGEAGNDKFIVNGGSNKLYGGNGSDTYQIGTANQENTTVIYDPYREGDTDTIEFLDKSLKIDMIDGDFHYSRINEGDGNLIIYADKLVNGLGLTKTISIQDFSNSNIETIKINNETAHLITKNRTAYSNSSGTVDRYIFAGKEWNATINSVSDSVTDILDFGPLYKSGLEEIWFEGRLDGGNLILDHCYTGFSNGYNFYKKGGTLTLSNFVSGSFAAMDGNTQRTIVAGTAAADTKTITSAHQYYFSAQGNDTISVKSNWNVVAGGDGQDKIVVGTASQAVEYNTISGGSGADTITIQNGNSNTVFAGAGDDVITVSNGRGFWIGGDAGNDTITIEENATEGFVYGDEGNDTFIINGGQNGVIGGIYGGPGNDTFVINGGARSYYGESGSDKFTFGNTGWNATINGITNEDTLDFSAYRGDYGGSMSQDGNGLKITYVMYNGDSETEVGVVNLSDYFSKEGNSFTLVRYDSGTKEKKTATVIAGGNNDNTVTGTDGSDWVISGNGNKTVNSGKGNDLIEVGWGDSGSEGTQIVNAGAGNDEIYADGGVNTLNGGSGNDYIFVENTDNNLLNGGSGSDTLEAYGNQHVFNGGDGNDTIIIHYGSGNKAYGNAGNDTINAKESGKSITAYGGDGTDTIYGGSGADTLYGGADNDRLYGYAGNDRLEGGDGNDYLVGGTGNDKLYGQIGADTLYGEGGNDYLVGGADNDKLYGQAGNDTLYAESGDDVLNGGAGDDMLYGQSGNDTITGGSGKDTFVYANGGGNDTITDYTAGDDTLYVSSGSISKTVLVNSNDVKFSVGSGTVLLTGAADSAVSLKDSHGRYTMSKTKITLNNAFTETLDTANYLSTVTTVDGKTTTEAVNIKGNSKANTIYGGSGKNKLYGYAGNDRLEGGSGNDYLVGGTGDDRLYGQVGADTLYGEGGNDYLVGGSGNDLLNGQAGNDTLYAESGDDVLNGGSGDDMLYGQSGNDTITGGSGRDTFVYANGGGSDTITDYTAGDDTLYVSGGSISETVLENSDNDVKFTVGSGTVTLSGAAGSVVSLKDSRGSYTMSKTKITLDQAFTDMMDTANYLSSVTTVDGKATTGAVNIKGNDKANTIYGGSGKNKLYGYAGNDRLEGGSGNDYLVGGAGDDRLYGQTGADTLYGENGDDYLVGGAGNDQLNGQAGNDTLYAESGDDVLNGGSGDDMLYGQSGNDTLTGGSGDDYLDGGTGNNEMSGGIGQDTFVHNLTYGNDIITDYTEGEDIIKIVDDTISKTELVNNGKDIKFTVGDGSITVKDGAEKAIRLEDGRGSYTVSGTTITLDSDFTGTLDSNHYLNTVVTIDGSATTNEITLKGNENDNVFYGGKGFCYMTGGEGDDIFVYNGTGKVEITDYQDGQDVIELAKGKINYSPRNSIFYYDYQNVIYVDNGNEKTVKIRDSRGSYTVSDTTIKLGSDFKGEMKMLGSPSGYYVGEKVLDGSAAINNLTLSGDTTADTVIYGGAGNDVLNPSHIDTCYGGLGSDTFVIHPAPQNVSVTIADYEEIDKVQIKASGELPVSGSNTLRYVLGEVKNIKLADNKKDVILEIGTVGDYFIRSRVRISYYESVCPDAQEIRTVVLKDATHKQITVSHTKGVMVDDFNNVGQDQEFKLQYGGEGNDTLYGSYGTDKLFGDSGNDVLYGEYGDDFLYGGEGDNTLYGGNGNDIFIFTKESTGDNTICDFETGLDIIKFNDGVGIASNSIDDSDVLLNLTTGGQIRINSAVGQNITFDNGNGSTTNQIFS